MAVFPTKQEELFIVANTKTATGEQCKTSTEDGSFMGVLPSQNLRNLDAFNQFSCNNVLFCHLMK
jgi:hypothetical protein